MTSPKYNENKLSEAFYGAWESRHEERYYSLHGSEEYREKIIQIAGFQAQVILDGATDLMSGISTERASKLYKQMLNTLRDDDSKSDKEKDIAWILEETLDDRLGSFTIEAQTTAENRINHLVAFLQNYPVSPYTRKYLHRMTQCYLFGFDEQCIIMCRSALEGAFIQAIPDSVCRKHKLKRNNQYYLGDRIEAAKEMGMFPPAFFDMVECINKIAKDIIHPDRYESVHLNDDVVQDILMKTVACISILEGE
jgi:hypothetical protein